MSWAMLETLPLVVRLSYMTRMAAAGKRPGRWPSAVIAATGLLIAGCVAPGAKPRGQPTSRRTPPTDIVWLESLDLSLMRQSWGNPGARQSVNRGPLKIENVEYAHGVGSHAESQLTIALHGEALRFEAAVGVDAEVKDKGSVSFVAYVDGREQARVGVLRGGMPPQRLTVNLARAQELRLEIEDGDDGYDEDHADWADALIVLRGGAKVPPVALATPAEPPPVIAHSTPEQPEIHAPRITGATPGRPFLFRIPASGEPPLAFAADGLPAGIMLDPQTGILSGALAAEGRTDVPVTVTNARGSCRATLTIVGGPDALALTPPMGWNSWNVWGTSVDDAKVRAAADALVSSALAACGFQYVNIDDGWEAERDESGRIQPNEKFPDMKALADYVHSRGLKLGIYSSPGPKTCAGFEGSYEHEVQDAQTWADWGIDLVKYDWCSYGHVAKDETLPELRKPYEVMQAALAACGRDIVYSMCQYGMGRVSAWGAEVGGHYWRTTGDISDSWVSMSRIGFGQRGLENFAGPGRWNDPDMLVVGHVGWGPAIRATRLTQNEQVTHITLWSLLASPLLLGCDLSKLDDFTHALLTNPEVLEVNQDPLGKQARCVAADARLETWARPLADGATAVGLFNRGRTTARVTARWSDLGLTGPQRVRNLWLRRDEGTFTDAYSADVPRHGAVLVRLRQPFESGVTADVSERIPGGR